MKIFYQKINNVFKNKFVFIFMFLLLILILIYFLGFRFNTTNSMPLGIYRINFTNNLNRLDYVQYCLKDEQNIFLAKQREYLKQGSCENKLQALLKQVVALENDEIKITDKGIFINNILVENSSYKNFDSLNRKMPQANFAKTEFNVPTGKALILSSSHAGSFDSRYFGLVDRKDLKKVKEIYVVRNKND